MAIQFQICATAPNADVFESEVAAYLRGKGWHVERRGGVVDGSEPAFAADELNAWGLLKETDFSDPRARRMIDYYETLPYDACVTYERDIVEAVGGDRQALGAVVANVEATAKKLGLGALWARDERRRGGVKERTYRKLLRVGVAAR